MKKRNEEHDQGASKSEGRTSVPHPETHLRLRQGAIPGIGKNHQRLCADFALVNLYLHRKRLAVLGA